MLRFPPHIVCWLQHNVHKWVHEDVRRWHRAEKIRELRWVSDEERERAFETDEVWELHWYSSMDGPIYIMAASSLEALIAYFAGRADDAG